MNPKEEIKRIRRELDVLDRDKNIICSEIQRKNERLKELLIITDNQISMDDTKGFKQ